MKQKSIFNLFLSLMRYLRVFQFSLQKMRRMTESHALLREVYPYIYRDICFLLGKELIQNVRVISVNWQISIQNAF